GNRMPAEPLFYERFFVYSGPHRPMPDKAYLLAEDIELEHLWLLEESHCLRSQVVQLCELKKNNSPQSGLHYASGSIESLLRMVDSYEGITVLPELAILGWSEEKLTHVHPFAPPVPEREISLVRKRKTHKNRITSALVGAIQSCLPSHIKSNTEERVIPILL
ncbi:MAG: LysR substrate-binding domain-containing protein, partial [Bacteroidota bacterium]|nr:LysR substrate-binding domain-containing protein [Bacteroidota bacterium]MDX5429716.1 LysR substrate-binding domain-containing protein [Bacteroidota bacterium]MDX5468497.1 LysR substrate-binding domain-containing protein [Bacteroidota bacterium]